MNLLRKTSETKAIESALLDKIGRQKAAEQSLPAAEAAVEVIANQPVPDDADAGARRARRHQRWAAVARLPKRLSVSLALGPEFEPLAPPAQL